MRQTPNYIAANGGPVAIGEEFYTVDADGVVVRHTLVDVVAVGLTELAVPESRYAIDISLCCKTEAEAVARAVNYARYNLDLTRRQVAEFERLLAKHGLLNPPPAAEEAVDEPVSVG